MNRISFFSSLYCLSSEETILYLTSAIVFQWADSIASAQLELSLLQEYSLRRLPKGNEDFEVKFLCVLCVLIMVVLTKSPYVDRYETTGMQFICTKYSFYH